MATIGKKIKALRERYGESQVDLGRIVSVSDKAVSAWENGKKRPRMKYVQKLAGHYNVTVSMLVEDAMTANSVVRWSESHVSGNNVVDDDHKPKASAANWFDANGNVTEEAFNVVMEAAKTIENLLPKRDERETALLEKYRKLSDRDKRTVDAMVDSLLKIDGSMNDEAEEKEAEQDSASSTEERNKYA